MNRPFPTQIGSVALLVGLTGLARPAAADPTPALRIVLQVYNPARIPPGILSRAKTDLTRIYRDVGIDARWADPAPTAIGRDGQHARTASSPRLTLTILSREMTDEVAIAGTALGATSGTREGGGRAAFIFYHRVERIARTYLNTARRRATYDIDNVIVLAHAMAHEIGHLLLPYGHSATGLMRAEWDGNDLRLAVRGRLTFTAEQVELIRAGLLTRIAGESASAIQ